MKNFSLLFLFFLPLGLSAQTKSGNAEKQPVLQKSAPAAGSIQTKVPLQKSVKTDPQIFYIINDKPVTRQAYMNYLATKPKN